MHLRLRQTLDARPLLLNGVIHPGCFLLCCLAVSSFEAIPMVFLCALALGLVHEELPGC